MRALAGLMVSLFALALSTAPVWSWGSDGHRAIGMIADLLLADLYQNWVPMRPRQLPDRYFD
jgi:hypothetical protein